MEVYYDDRQDDIEITDEIKSLVEKSIASVLKVEVLMMKLKYLFLLLEMKK